jgi:hypothetical protein
MEMVCVKSLVRPNDFFIGGFRVKVGARIESGDATEFTNLFAAAIVDRSNEVVALAGAGIHQEDVFIVIAIANDFSPVIVRFHFVDEVINPGWRLTVGARLNIFFCKRPIVLTVEGHAHQAYEQDGAYNPGSHRCLLILDPSCSHKVGNGVNLNFVFLNKKRLPFTGQPFFRFLNF